VNRALVTGGAGFIGSHLSRRLLNEGVSVVALDNLGSGCRENVRELESKPAFTFVEGDVRDPFAEQIPAPKDVDTVFHFASRASPTDFEEHALEIAETNSEGTKRALKYATDIEATVVYASTSEVYGDPEVHPQTETYNGNVNCRGLRSAYDESKRFGETLCETYHRTRGTDVRTVRIFNTYGPRMRFDDGRVVPTFLDQALRGDDLTIYGDGTQTRSFCYVDDLVRGILRVADEPDIDGTVMNLGHTNEVTINTFADVIRDLVETDVGISYEPLPDDDPQKRRPDISKAREEIDWKPTVSLRSGLKRTAAYFVQQ